MGLFSDIKRLIFYAAVYMTVVIALWALISEARAGERSPHFSPDAVLKKDGRKTALEDFCVGDWVRVGWRKDSAGHRIESLEAVTQAPGKMPGNCLHFPPAERLLGTLQHHIIQKRETLLDIARRYDLGFNEMQELYPDLDPWIPPKGMELIIPSERMLPEIKGKGIIINIAEMRMYYFPAGGESVRTYPVGLGDRDYPTPVGTFRIGEKRVNPTWYIPPSLQYKYPVKVVPPGPDNPLGKYWMGLEGTDYGIHGTNIPWAVGRLVTHGCIRMYPEDIPKLFNLVEPGTQVRIIYEPIKIGRISGRIFVEIHRDIYNRIEDLAAYGHERLREKGMLEGVDPDKLRHALELQDGLPRDISL
jgi:L,D-transpeptidase ErfK/SrfK